MAPYPPNGSDVSPASDVRRYTAEIPVWIDNRLTNQFVPSVNASDHDALLAARDARIAGLEADVRQLGRQIDRMANRPSEPRLLAEVSAHAVTRDAALKLTAEYARLSAENAAMRELLRLCNERMPDYDPHGRYLYGDRIDALLASKAGEKT